VKLLYVAAGIPVPGTLGGSTHAYAVAHGLARLGHTVHLVAASREGWAGLAPFARPSSTQLAGFHLHHQDVPKALSLCGAQAVLRLARALRPDVVLERYYNFAGAGLLAARHLGVPALLEVNALIVDPPAVRKRRLDDALGGPMRRWATWQCHSANVIVTPLHTTVPAAIPRTKIVELPWGAEVERFAAVATARAARPVPALPCRQTVIFMGSFRPWHGVTAFVQAARLLLAQGRNLHFLLVGDGPERQAAAALAATHAGAFTFTGAVPYDAMPDLLATADIGVAPFTTAPHPALQTAGFFWSPLKIYEYMAAGLPVVTPAIVPLSTVIRDGREGILYPEGDVPALAAAIARLLDDPTAARTLGQAARARVVAHYSWHQHCVALEQILFTLLK